MLLLASTSDLVRIVTGSAVAIDVHASWVDLAAGVVTPGRTNTKITTATTTTVVGSPAASTIRNAKTLHIQNIHASSSNLVTVEHTDGTNSVVLENVTLLAGESLDYVEGEGFILRDAAGMVKTDPVVIAGDLLVKTLAADVANSTTTAAKITGLDTVCGTGTWAFEYFIRFLSATSTVGPKLGCNHTGTVTSFIYNASFATTAATDSSGVMDQVNTAPVVMGVMSDRAKSTTAPLIVTAGVDTINVDILIVVHGLVIVTVSGNLELYHASETATSTTIKAGSALRLTKTG